MTQHFWKRWSSEYLTLLQSRSKWRIFQKNLDIGDLVLIKHDNSPPLQWKLEKVTETFPGKDGKVRVVKVKTQTSELGDHCQTVSTSYKHLNICELCLIFSFF
ncbi:integrase catalytic domain-containing protein [Trichonephila clavata]|uniref:Integrase catalytic domain-containing protein n=1 Tax=Trichonephila clavata TaxID=2740835 RepID=A0A8X6GV78_TRICU|nr:integrase catalytic domain-containing protein [Trichonephila clavata]